MTGILAGLIGSFVSGVVNKYFTVGRTTATYQPITSVEDSSGNVYFVSSNEIYKYKKDGTFLWAKSVATSLFISDATTDGTSLYVVMYPPFPFGPGATTVMKVNSDGTFGWAYVSGNYLSSRGDGSPSIKYSSVTGKLCVLSSTLSASKISGYSYLLELNLNGTKSKFTFVGNYEGQCIDFDSSGNIYLLLADGNAKQILKLNSAQTSVLNCYFLSHPTGGVPKSMSVSSSGDMFFWDYIYSRVHKINSNFTTGWAYDLGVTSMNPPAFSKRNVKVDSTNGFVYAATRTSTNGDYIVKLSASTGAASWQRLISSTQTTTATDSSSVEITSTGDVLYQLSAKPLSMKMKADGTPTTGYNLSTGQTITPSSGSLTIASNAATLISSSTPQNLSDLTSSFTWSSTTITLSTVSQPGYYIYT